MKSFILVSVILFALIARAAVPPQASKPLAQGQIMDLVSAGMESSDLVKVIRDHGIDFDLTDDYLESLRKAGAPESVIQALQAARPKPLTRGQVLQLLTGHVPSQRAASVVKDHGIDFLADEQYLDTLRIAGADDTLLSALRAASARLMGELALMTSPSAAIYLDGEFEGRANPQGELVMKVKPGTHALKVTLDGRKDFQQNVSLAAHETTRITVALESAGPPPTGTSRVNSKDGLTYNWVTPGTFMMGCSPGDAECDNDEKPAHSVTITRGMWVGQLEATVGAYKRFATANGRAMPPAPNSNSGWADDTLPIVNLNWNEAHDFCAWGGGRLPTEAEWEYAARGGSTQGRYGPMESIGWSDHAHPGGQLRANGFGLFDVLGNVSEWVNDFWANNYTEAPLRDPTGASEGGYHSIRSGSYAHTDKFSRFSARDLGKPEERSESVGVRCIQDASQ